MIATAHPIRILIADDSGGHRDLLTSILQDVEGFQVIGTARTGKEAVRLTKRLRPDIVTMDIYMPEMNGYEATRRIMEETPTPILIISGNLDSDERRRTFDALSAGALSAVKKPTVNSAAPELKQLTSQIRLMAEIKVVRRWPKRETEKGHTLPTAVKTPAVQMIAIASSTGGPGALRAVFSRLPADFPVPILVVQHVTAGFGQGLADWLNAQSSLTVRIARHGDDPQAGDVLLAPDDRHMILNHMGLITFAQAPPLHGIRPSADYLFHSIATVYGRKAIGVVLTGMGSDGAAGLRAMRHAGARTIAQDQTSCTVFGMPAAAIKMEAASVIRPLDRIAPTLLEYLKGDEA